MLKDYSEIVSVIKSELLKVRIKLNPITSRKRIVKLEEKYNFKIPESYKVFLTEIGNGGESGYYGIYGVDTNNFLKYLERNRDILNKEPFLKSDMTDEEWATFSQNIDNAVESEDDSEYERLEDQFYTGLIPIECQGCSYEIYMVLNGKDAGKLVYIDMDFNVKPFFCYENDILEWYERFLREKINGYKQFWFGMNIDGDENQLMEKFSKASSDAQKLNILSSFDKFPELCEKSQNFILNIFKSKSNTDLKNTSLKLLLQFGNRESYDILHSILKSDNAEDYIDCFYGLLRNKNKNEIDIFYQDIINCLDRFSEKKLQRIMYLLSDCSKLKTADIIHIAKNKNVSTGLRRSTIFAIGYAKDKLKYADEFVEFLNDDDLWIVHQALQSFKDVYNKRFFNKCRELMKKYPKNDEHYIYSNAEMYVKRHIYGFFNFWKG